MYHTLSELYQRHSKLIKYGVIGALSSSVDFIMYSLLVLGGVDMMMANVVGVNVGILTSFTLNRRYNFRVKDRAKQRFVTFYAVGLSGLAISSLMLYAMVDGLGLNEIVAKVITIVAVALFQFVVNSRITFRQTHSTTNTL
ncbi:MAG: GtrA family protein [Candidatus Amulumruptor caecigallinarius]|nr:GtrA family protein [Candidatus Amulumruptor caecigallinarius]MCM1397238.1 GtrA family protein [Candidatus Amulumruptor caecigallinarius]MCM1453088.1 GtrA family protein [bacterium]